MKYIKKFEKVNDKFLIYAIDDGDVERVKELIKQGCNLNVKTSFDDGGDTALIKAIRFNNYDIVKLLIDAGADINLKNEYRGYTPLMASVRYFNSSDDKDIFEYILDAKPDLNAVDNQHGTAIMMTIYHHHWNMMYALLDAGADPFIKDDDGDDIFDYVPEYHLENIEKRSPEVYKEYMLRKDVEKYNL